MAVTYSCAYANSGHTGAVPATASGAGVLLWTAGLVGDEAAPAQARLVLCTDDRLVVEGLTELFCFDRNGKLLWHRKKWYGTQVYLKNDRLYCLSSERRDQLEAVDLNGQLCAPAIPVPGLVSRAFVVLFEPFAEGLVAEIQDNGDAHGSGCNRFLYKMSLSAPGFVWSVRHPDTYSRLFPLVAWKAKRVITTSPTEAFVFDLDGSGNPEALARFPLPFGDATNWMSCDDDGHLYWSGSDGMALFVSATDMNGQAIWAYRNDPSIQGGKPICPPIVVGSRIYVATSRMLYVFESGKLGWFFGIEDANFEFATGLTDGSVLLAGRTRLVMVNPSGTANFDLDMDLILTSPPVVDSLGRIYVAASDKLIALE